MSHAQRHQHIEAVTERLRTVCHTIDMHTGTNPDSLVAQVDLSNALSEMLIDLILNDQTYVRLARHELRVNAAQKAVDHIGGES